MYQEKINEYIEAQKENMIEDLKKLVRINSERTDAKEGMPYGEGPVLALKTAEEMLKEYGFSTINYDNYVLAADMNDKEKQLDILAHLDVVPGGEDWTVTSPFEPVVQDGRIYGRGTCDDKGPAIAAIYALRAIKELKIPLSKNVRLILGSDEECGSSDIREYYKREKEAPMTFSPDADYPLIHIEKGRLSNWFWADYLTDESVPRVLSIQGGSQPNVIPGKAKGVVTGIQLETVEQIAAQVSKKTGVSYSFAKEGENIQILAKGRAGHASTPELAINALTGLIQLLVTLPLAETPGFLKLCKLSQLFQHQDWEGVSLSIQREEKESGKLTIGFTVLDYTETGFKGTFDSRIPLGGTDENVRDVISSQLKAVGIEMEQTPMTPVHYVPEDSKLVQTLLACYNEHTGENGKPFAIGGGTYVHELKNGVAFGCATPGVDNHMHGADEFMELDVLFLSAKIFADAVFRLCQ